MTIEKFTFLNLVRETMDELQSDLSITAPAIEVIQKSVEGGVVGELKGESHIIIHRAIQAHHLQLRPRLQSALIAPL
jgi:hypothetical protein